eukprot:gnl/MRDRNA2_/MRDRNA2_26049_c0_seq1.p1 gnl/MRDRNA2_/MRDRNA2_26049_c0~~gnl/MRDRNA2_/MRDRNA2_26049_c0_seq1.p1  ORF type:complete len:256 (+),score=34.58 gnl/MRDRNA2_/MRDRNA2_26049_c0_seq1:71-769(+)
MTQQRDITDRHRAILVNWLMTVHSYWNEGDETLWVCIQIIDRYLEISQVERARLKLVGVTAMLIAAKLVETPPTPMLSDCSYITDHTYSEQEILEMEVRVLNVLEFRLACPTVAHFLTNFQRGLDTKVHKHLAQYLAELSLLDVKFLKFKPSHLAAAAALLSNTLMKQRIAMQEVWGPHMERLTRYTTQELDSCVHELRALYESCKPGPPILRVKRKFASTKYMGVSCLALA